MAIRIVFVPADGLILATCRGKINFKEITAAHEQGYKLALEHRVFRFLADAREAEPAMETHEIYDLPEYYASMGIPRATMVAVVTPPDRKYYDDFRFFETICRNNGYHYVQTFEEIEAAKEWLTHNRPPGPPPR
ncbi:MAG TPA: hypothetical protein VGJ94_06395 [Syntrophorhabdaceae bacterium]|jgi:hypothetical protein